MTDILKECLTCAYLDTVEGICTNEFSERKGEKVEDKDRCEAWSLDDLVKKIYECI